MRAERTARRRVDVVKVLRARRHRRGRGGVVQPALPHQGAPGGHAAEPARHVPAAGRPPVVRGQGARDPRRGGRGGRAHRGRRPRLPGQRAGVGQAPARARARGRAGHAPAAGPAAGGAAACARVCPAAPTRSRPCTCRARWRRRARPASAWCSRSCCSCRPGCCCTSRSSSSACTRRRCPSRATLSRAFLDGLPFELTGAPAAGAGRARGRPAPGRADAAPAAGRRRLGQDGRRPVLPRPRRRGRAAGRAPGADRDARRAARGDGGAARRCASRPPSW